MFRCAAFILFFGILFSGCVKDFSKEGGAADQGTITLSFSAIVKNQPFDFATEYTNEWGEPYTVTTFKYYVHNISLVNSEGNSVAVSSDYFLVDESQPLSKQMQFKVKSGEYARLIFGRAFSRRPGKTDRR